MNDDPGIKCMNIALFVVAIIMSVSFELDLIEIRMNCILYLSKQRVKCISMILVNGNDSPLEFICVHMHA